MFSTRSITLSAAFAAFTLSITSFAQISLSKDVSEVVNEIRTNGKGRNPIAFFTRNLSLADGSSVKQKVVLVGQASLTERVLHRIPRVKSRLNNTLDFSGIRRSGTRSYGLMAFATAEAVFLGVEAAAIFAPAQLAKAYYRLPRPAALENLPTLTSRVRTAGKFVNLAAVSLVAMDLIVSNLDFLPAFSFGSNKAVAESQGRNVADKANAQLENDLAADRNAFERFVLVPKKQFESARDHFNAIGYEQVLE